ncbi:MAG TPA: hypothetical protein VIM34_13805 [Burkholderiaceae bacterium]
MRASTRALELGRGQLARHDPALDDAARRGDHELETPQDLHEQMRVMVRGGGARIAKGGEAVARDGDLQGQLRAVAAGSAKLKIEIDEVATLR